MKDWEDEQIPSLPTNELLTKTQWDDEDLDDDDVKESWEDKEEPAQDIAVTGESAWAPSKDIDIHDVEKESVVGEQNDKNMEDDLEFNHGLENIDVDTSSSSIETITQDNVNKRKRDSKKIGVGAKVSKQLDVLLEIVANRSSNFRSKDKPGCSIEEVMKVVKKMPEVVNDDDLFMKAADVLTERKNREMFVALSEPDTQIMWLKNKRV